MMRMLAATLLFLVASGSWADILVLRDGSTVVTKGTWEVRGASIVFTLPNGTLGSLRVRDVDLDASAVATAEAARPQATSAAETATPERRAAVLTLTDDDIQRAPQDVIDAAAARLTAPAGDPASEGEASPATPKGGVAVAVASWEESYSIDEGGVRISGSLRNNGDSLATGVSVSVRVYDEEGNILGESPARVGDAAIRAGGTTGFTAVFPGVGAVNDVKFEVRHNAIEFTRPAPAPPTPGDEG